MPNRIIKESICTSENIDQLTAFQETFFLRLTVNCDDFGRMDARQKILSSRLYPLKDVKPAAIEDALRALVAADLIFLYTVGDRPYLQMKTWEKHQRIRAKQSKYPPPDDGICCQMTADDSKRGQMTADDVKCSRNPIQSNIESESNTKEGKTQQRFTPPTPEEVSAYCKERGNGIDPNRFVDYYAARGWELKPGQKMKNWQACVRTWEANDKERGKAVGKPAKVVVAQQYSQRDYSGQEDSLADALKVLQGNMM